MNNYTRVTTDGVEVSIRDYLLAVDILKKGALSSTEITEALKLVSDLGVNINSLMLSLRRVARYSNKPLIKVLKEFMREEDDYCISVYKKVASTIEIEEQIETIKHFLDLFFDMPSHKSEPLGSHTPEFIFDMYISNKKYKDLLR